MSCNLDIAIFCGGMEIDPNTIKTKSLGGSETAGISMAHALVKLGHKVLFFCNTKEIADVDGVKYMPLEYYDGYAVNCPHDVHIVQRIPEIFHKRINSKLNILWQHDVALKRGRTQFHGALWQVDKVFCMSQWQIDQYKEIMKIDDDDLFLKTTNGIKLPTDNVLERERNPKQLIFTNRPERGMDTLLFNICPKIWAKDKDVEIVIAGYDNTTQEMASFYQSLHDKINQYRRQGFQIEHIGALNKTDLYELYKTAKLFVYPTKFWEISCITAMETQMCGLPMITSHLAALPETLHQNAGILIKGDAKSEKYQDRFVNAIFELLENDRRYEAMQQAGISNAQQYDWDNVAQQWNDYFFQEFENKTADRQSLYKHLYEKEDIMALRYLVEKVDSDTEWSKKLYTEYDYLDDEQKYKKKYKQLGKEYAKIENNLELRSYGRLDVAFSEIQNWVAQNQIKVPKVLDFASGIGNEAIIMAKSLNAKVTAVNISPEENELVKKMINKHGKDTDISVIEADSGDKLDKDYDILFLGEILEHQPYPNKFLDKMEQNVRDDGLIVITVPYGMWDDKRKAHLWNFERMDFVSLLKNKKEMQIKMLSGGMNDEKKEVLGWWIVTYKKNGKPCEELDLERKINIQSPKQSLSACLITLNAESQLHRCLKSVQPIVDEIIIADNGSTDSTLEIAKQYNAKIIKCKKATEIGFDSARNISIADAKSEWILWIDSDEELLKSFNVRKYLRNNYYKGYSIKQHHFSTDAGAMKIDMPVRLFRNNKGVKFLGHVHEHPEVGVNEGVGASTILSDVDIAHDGYLTEDVRRDRFKRNIDLMLIDREKNPERLLGKFLIIRDWVHIARYEIENNRGMPTEVAIKCCEQATEMFRKEFLEDNNLYKDEALMFYSEALTILGQGLEYRFNINAGLEKTEAQRTDTIAKFLNDEEFSKYISTKIKVFSEAYTGDFA
jgi:glycosyltransferase involved in cell wall biosynthesis/2-polyprenyl-3-methyl-5-hydroxy-6-metoxy-1,4-benzoquinol methylase